MWFDANYTMQSDVGRSCRVNVSSHADALVFAVRSFLSCAALHNENNISWDYFARKICWFSSATALSSFPLIVNVCSGAFDENSVSLECFPLGYFTLTTQTSALSSRLLGQLTCWVMQGVLFLPSFACSSIFDDGKESIAGMSGQQRRKGLVWTKEGEQQDMNR